MTSKVPDERLRVVDDALDDSKMSGLPAAVQLVVADIAETAREGLSATARMAVLGEMMEVERTALCGPIHAKDSDRHYERRGTTPTLMVLGGRKVPIRRPLMHATDG